MGPKMPKYPENSQKIPELITDDGVVFSLKSKSATLTLNERAMLNKITSVLYKENDNSMK